ncbi:MAG: hypothetical protein HFJ20_06355 [Clostridia bacterium]|nr:hypothetical protein [Clostridia bacterium]
MATFSNRKKGAKSGKILGLDYSEVYNLIKELEQLDGDVKRTTEKSLTKSQKHITKNLHKEMKKHKQTGETEKSIVENPPVIWVGNMYAEIDVGFDISNGGLPSIFLMYGTPRAEKDQKLFNAIYGRKTQKEISEIQADIFFDAIGKAGVK